MQILRLKSIDYMADQNKNDKVIKDLEKNLFEQLNIAKNKIVQTIQTVYEQKKSNWKLCYC